MDPEVIVHFDVLSHIMKVNCIVIFIPTVLIFLQVGHIYWHLYLIDIWHKIFQLRKVEKPHMDKYKDIQIIGIMMTFVAHSIREIVLEALTSEDSNLNSVK